MFWLLLLLPFAVFASERNLTSDLPMEFDGIHNAVIARQNATFTDKNFIVIADEIRYSKNDETATASGNVRLSFKGSRLVAEKVTYKTKNRHFTAENFRLGYFPYMISGKRIDGTPEEFHVEHATLYGSQTGTMAPNVYIDHMTLRPGEKSTKINLHAALARIGPVPFLPIPAAYAEIPRKNTLDLRVTAGHSKTYGTFLRTESLYPIADDLRGGANLDYYTTRGWLMGPRLVYQTDTINSILNTGYIEDHGNTGVDSRGMPIPKGRGFVDFEHKQQIGNVQLTQQVQYWSDSEILRDFRPDTYRDNQAPDSFTEAVLPLKDWYISLFARYDPNNFDMVPQALPELRIDRTWTPIGKSKVYYSFYNSFAHIEEAPMSYNRYDGIFSVERPFAITRWWQFTPVVAVRETYYQDANNGTTSGASVSRTLGQIGFDSQWSFYHIWEFKNSVWNIDGLKHTVQPVLQYRYLPNATQGSMKIPDIESRVFDTNLRPTDFFYMADVDNLTSMNLLRLGLKQSLQTRNKTTGEFPSRDLLTLELYQDYNFTPTSGVNAHPTWDSTYLLSEISPCPWISVGVFARANFNQGIWQEDRLYTTLKDGDYRTLTFSTRFLRQSVQQYEVIFTQRLTDRLTFFADTAYDEHLGDFSMLYYGIRQRLRSGWEADYGIQRNVNDSRDSSTQFTFRFRWLNF